VRALPGIERVEITDDRTHWYRSVLTSLRRAASTGPAGSGFTLTLSGPDSPAYLPTIGNQFWTTSGANYLGLNNPDTAFETGDAVTFSFNGPVNGFGLFVIGTGDVGGGDITLTSGATSVSNAAVADFTDGNGDYAFYIGLVDNLNTFNSVTLSVLNPLSERLLPIDVDDVTLATISSQHGPSVPEPGSLALLLLGATLFSLTSYLKRR